MITFIGCVRRLADVTHDDFETHWRDLHGPLLVSVSEFTRHVVSYTQFHLIDYGRPNESGQGDPWHGFDGIAMMSFKDVEAFQAGFQEPLFTSVLRADAEKFADHDTSIQFMTRVDGPVPPSAVPHGSIAIFEFAGPDAKTPLRTWAKGGLQAPKPLSVACYEGSVMAAVGEPAGGEPNSPPPTNITVCSFANAEEAETVLLALNGGELGLSSGGERPVHLMARAHAFIEAPNT